MQRRCQRGSVDELELEPVAAGLRAALLDAPDTVVEARHLAAMRDAAPVVGGASRRAASEPRRGAERRRRPRRMRAVWAAVLVGAGLGVPSVAVAGALPGPAQHAASRAAAIVHLRVPDTAPKATPHRATPATHATVAVTTAPPTVTTNPPASHDSVTSTTQAPQGTNAPSSPAAPKRTPTADPPHVQPKQPNPSPPPTHKKKNDHQHHHHPHHKKKPSPTPKRHHGKKPPHTKGSKPPFGPI